MSPADGSRLFHAIVLVGVSLTGGTIASCGGATATSGETDAGRDGNVADGGYASIGYNGDAYSGIGINGDGYAQISIDAQALDHAAGDAILIDGPTDAHYADISVDSPADAPECYPCIAPAGGG